MAETLLVVENTTLVFGAKLLGSYTQRNGLLTGLATAQDGHLFSSPTVDSGVNRHCGSLVNTFTNSCHVKGNRSKKSVRVRELTPALTGFLEAIGPPARHYL
jgi:hypothetical protein